MGKPKYKHGRNGQTVVVIKQSGNTGCWAVFFLFCFAIAAILFLILFTPVGLILL